MGFGHSLGGGSSFSDFSGLFPSTNQGNFKPELLLECSFLSVNGIVPNQ